MKSACNHVSSLKSVRSGLGLFYEVSRIFLLLSDRVHVGFFKNCGPLTRSCQTTHAFIFLCDPTRALKKLFLRLEGLRIEVLCIVP